MRIGNDFVIIENVRAGVCVECGERYYPPGIVDRLRDIDVNRKHIQVGIRYPV